MMRQLTPFRGTDCPLFFHNELDPAPAAQGGKIAPFACWLSDWADATPAGAPFPETQFRRRPSAQRGNMVAHVAILLTAYN